MQNSGLPEAGDCVLSLPEEYLDSSTRYREIANLPPSDAGHDRIETHAKQRKDLSVKGFVELRSRVEEEGPQALDAFYRAAAALCEDQTAEWRELWHLGAEQASATTGAQILALDDRDLSYLDSGVLQVANLRVGSPRPGMCGRITNFDPEPSAGRSIGQAEARS
jgi:hypothetical protein